MGYAMLHEYGANTETPFFTPTGPLLRCLPAKRLPFAVRCSCPLFCAHTLYRCPLVPTAVFLIPEVSTVLL